MYWYTREYSPEEFVKFVYDVKEYTRSNVSAQKRLEMLGLEFREDIPMTLIINYTKRNSESSVFQPPSRGSKDPYNPLFGFTKTGDDELVTPYLREVLNIALKDNIITEWSLDAGEPTRVSRAERAARRGAPPIEGGKKRRKSVKRSKRRSVKRKSRKY